MQNDRESPITKWPEKNTRIPGAKVKEGYEYEKRAIVLGAGGSGEKSAESHTRWHVASHQ
jgi:hypothetical protein